MAKSEQIREGEFKELVPYSDEAAILIPPQLMIAERSRRKKEAEIRETVEKQRKLPDKEFTKLIQYDRTKITPSKETLQIIRTGMKYDLIPAQHWYVFAGRDGRTRIAPDSHGLFKKAQLDPKIYIGKEDIWEHLPTEAEPWVVAKVRLHFYGGGPYEGTQTKFISWTDDLKEIQNACNKAMTQALGKAARSASPITFAEIAEEIEDFERERSRPSYDFKVPAAGQIRSLGEFLAVLYKNHPDKVCTTKGVLDRAKIAKILKVTRLEEIKDFNQAYEQFQVAISGLDPTTEDENAVSPQNQETEAEEGK